MAKASTLHDAFIDELRDTYDAEKQILKALPKLVKAARSTALRTAFERHLRETQGHVERLESVFASLGEKPKGKHCAGMAGILTEGSHTLEETFDDAATDATLIAAAQRVEHYEMAAYGTLVAWAQAMGHTGALKPLQLTLNEEKAADLTLSTIAENVNADASKVAHPAAAHETTVRGKARAAGRR
jgi:ferritin-like metal-binding protein YciE